MAGPAVPIDSPAHQRGLSVALVDHEQRLGGSDVVAGRQVLGNAEPGEPLGQLAGPDVEAYPAAHSRLTNSR